MAEKQNDDHWRAKHKVKFEQEEVDRQLDLEDQKLKAIEQRLKKEEKMKNEQIIREMKDQELIRKAKKGVGKLIIDQDGKYLRFEFEDDPNKTDRYYDYTVKRWIAYKG